jgi:hypothetical protein
VEGENETAARARALVGARFRPQGRRREHGLDCLGLVGLAADLPVQALPSGYRMRSRVSDEMLALDFGGSVRRIATSAARAGDVVLVETAMGLHHFVVLVEEGYVHADARLERVVLTPGAVPWPAVACWRVGED